MFSFRGVRGVGWLAGWLADENDALCYNCKHDSGKLDHPTLSYIRTAPG